MSDFPIYEFDPHEVPADFHQAIGLLITCAAQTEDLIDEAIAGCVGTDMEMGAAITAHLGIPARLSILRATAEIRISDTTKLAKFDQLIAAVERAFEARNAIAHQRWLKDRKTGAVATIKEKARVTYTMELVPMTVDQIKRDALFLYDVGLRLHAFLDEAGLMPAFPSESRVRGQNSETARRKRRKGLLDE